MIRSFMVALSFRRIYLSNTYDTTITAIFQIISVITGNQAYNNRTSVLFMVHGIAYNKKKMKRRYCHGILYKFGGCISG